MKKVKQQNAYHSKIFTPFRAIGYIADADCPISIQSRGGKVFITASIGNAFQIYNDQLRLMFVSQEMDGKISAICSRQNDTYVAVGAQIQVFQRAKLETVMVEEGSNTIVNLQVFGNLLLSFHADNKVLVWNLDSYELQSEIQVDMDITGHCVHPSTYVNKVVFAGVDGRLQLWNIKSHKMLYEFLSHKSPITCLASTPVIDVIAVGHADGTVILINLKTDIKLMNFSMDSAIKAISFRSDDFAHMATSDGDGNVAIWNLNERRLDHLFKAHDKGVHSLHYMHQQAVLITCGADNALKVWIFDNQDGTARLLRSRSGHYAPVTQVSHYGEDGKFVLSSGQDKSLRLFCTWKDEQSMELSQGAGMNKKASSYDVHVETMKLPPVTCISSSPQKSRDWDNILTSHSNYEAAKSWSMDRKAIGKHSIKTPDGSGITSVYVSRCGNFGVIGTGSGLILSLNMQSGAVRRQYDGNTKLVSFVALDAVNKKVVSCSVDGSVRMFDFQSGACLQQLQIDSGITMASYNLDNDLLAAVNEDFVIKLVDCDTAKVVRSFIGHKGFITGSCFSFDGRWLMTCSQDSTIRTWDIPSGHLVDIFKCQSVPTSMSFSPSGDFLITSHHGSCGLYMWANKLRFSNVLLGRVDPDQELAEASQPTVAGNSSEQSSDLMTLDSIYYIPVDTLSSDLITLSLEPESKWQNLLMLENIKRRNKPKVAPKAPESAPFFLPVVEGIQPKFDVLPNSKDEPVSKLTMFEGVAEQSDLMHTVINGDFDRAAQMLKAMSPTQIDVEIRSINTMAGTDELLAFMKCLLSLIQSMQGFEIYQACLAVTLRVHADDMMSEAFASILKDIEDAEKTAYQKVDPLFKQVQAYLQAITR